MRLTRRRMVGRMLAGAALALGIRPASAGAVGSSSMIKRLIVRNASRPFAGDRRRFATISPRSGGARAGAVVDLFADRPVDATLEVVSRNGVGAHVVSREAVSLTTGRNRIPWAPAPSLKPGSYILRFRQLDKAPAPVLGSAVVRVIDVEATFRQRSARPGETVALTVQTDAPWLKLTLLRCGPGAGSHEQQLRDERHPGERAGADRPQSKARPGDNGAGHDRCRGERAVRGPSRRAVRAPRVRALVVRPEVPAQRIAVVLPTTTWQAYNFYDRNGDGFGDTWYSLFSQKRIALDRPHLRRGVPERFRSYEVQFLHWLASRGHVVDTYADEDIELFASPDLLRFAYDLIVFPGHTEYVTKRLYDHVEGYRDLGGRLMFLSANNFFRHVVRSGHHARLIGEWRKAADPSPPCSARSTSRTTAGNASSPTRSSKTPRPAGRSQARDSAPAPSSDATASRSTRRPPTRRRARRFSRASPISSDRVAQPR